MRARRTADVVVVGGGVMGTSIAHALVSRGVRGVFLLERRFLCAGSTGKSGAIVRQHYSIPIGLSLVRRSIEVFRDFAARVGGECGWTATGMLFLVDERDRPALEASVRMQRGQGVQTAIVEAEEIAARWPALDVSDRSVGCYEPDAGFADPVRTTRAFADAAVRRGAEIREGCEVRGLLIRGGRCVGVETDAGPIHARTVILAAGPWSAVLARRVGIELPTHAARVQVALTRPTGTAAHSELPVVIDLANAVYFKPWAGPVVQVGSLDPSEGDARVDPDHFVETADPVTAREMLAAAARRWPVLGRGIAVGGFAALYSITPDWYPLVGFAPAVDGLFVATGFSGHGFKFAPAIGELTADLVTGRRPWIDPSPLRLTRFADGAPVRSAYAYSIIG